MLHRLPPEIAHRLTVSALKLRGVRLGLTSDDPVLRMQIWGRSFPNPIGMAAGFDKDAEVYDALLKIGFGFVEVGSITPEPQAGNPKPRLFRLVEDRALINRMGFNSGGLAQARRRLAARRPGSGGIVGINLGKNKTGDAEADYARGVREMAAFADYLVINISSPNTPGLRALQSAGALQSLIDVVQQARAESMPRAGRNGLPPMLLKVAPDLTAEDRRDIAEIATAGAVDGLIVSNTTTGRPPGLRGSHRSETGGLSGAPLFGPSTEVLRDMYRLTEGRIPLIGVGGVSSGADAYAKVRAGASLVQLYTALTYQGPDLLRRIKVELAQLLRRDGFTGLSEAVGADHRTGAAR
ncbi:MAG TPA: quinone-dependent dihydroorotate dehydrogenase [Dongiaceae bacterium]